MKTVSLSDIIECNKNNDIISPLNKLLYDMCRNNPDHIDNGVVLMKLSAINRIYAAQLERQFKKVEGEDLLVDRIVPSVIEKADSLFSGLKVISELQDEAIVNILMVHKQFMEIIVLKENAELQNKTRGLRSFCSKYLHFHFPHLFFIYDSIAGTNINQYVKDISEYNHFYEDKKVDVLYAKYFLKCYKLKNQLLKNCSTREEEALITTRSIDNILLPVISKQRVQKT